MTPRERVFRLFKKEPIDHMPLFSGLSMIVSPALAELGYTFAGLHTDAERLARAAVLSSKMMGFDSIVVPIDLGILPEALGNKVNFYEGADEVLFPTVSQRIWSGLDEIQIPTDIMSRGRLPLVSKAIEVVKSEAPDYPVGTWLRGPFTQLGQILELEMVLKAAFKNRDAVADALDLLADTLITIGQAWLAAGADYITLSEPGASADVLPPRIFKQLVQPRLVRILESWSAIKVLHISGKSDPLVEAMNQCGADAIAVDIKNDLKESRVKIGDNSLLFGNFEVYDLPCKAETTVDQAVAAIEANIEAGVDAVWPGSDLWPEIKEENMRAIVNTVHEYGRKPSPAVGRLA